MIDLLLHFFYMNGYGRYVFTAYGCVLTYLFIQWFIPWQRFQKYLRKQNNTS